MDCHTDTRAQHAVSKMLKSSPVRTSVSHLDSWIKAVRHLSDYPGANAPRIRRSQLRINSQDSSPSGCRDEAGRIATASEPHCEGTQGRSADDSCKSASSPKNCQLNALALSHTEDVVKPTTRVPPTPPKRAQLAATAAVVCPFPDCGKIILSGELPAHQKSVHPHVSSSTARCVHCLAAINRRDKAKHENCCLEAFVCCPLGCGKQFSRRDVTTHMYSSWRSHDPNALDDSSRETNPEDPHRVICTLLRALHDEERASALKFTLASRAKQTLEWLKGNYPNNRSLLGTLHKSISSAHMRNRTNPINVANVPPAADQQQQQHTFFSLDEILSEVDTSLQLEPLDIPSAAQSSLAPPSHQCPPHLVVDASNSVANSDLQFEVMSPSATSFALEARPHSATSKASSPPPCFVEVPSHPLDLATNQVMHSERAAEDSDDACSPSLDERSFEDQAAALLAAIETHEGSILHLIHVVQSKEEADDSLVVELQTNVEDSLSVLCCRIGEWRDRFFHRSVSGGPHSNSDGVLKPNEAKWHVAEAEVDDAWRRLDRLWFTWKQTAYASLYSSCSAGADE